MEHRRLIDLQPPPPSIFHQQYPHHHHHHHLRYEHVLPHPPNLIPQHSHNHLPQPPPPQPQQPHNHFPQLPPPQPHQPHYHFPQPLPQKPHQPNNHFPQLPPQQPYQPHNHFLQLPPPQPYQPPTHFPQPPPPQPHNDHLQPPPPQPHNHHLQPPPPQPHNHYPQPPPPQPNQPHNQFLPPPPPQLHQLHIHFPPPLPPQPHQPNIHIPPMPPPQPCQSCFDLPPHRFHHYQIDLPPKPCHSNFPPPPPPSLPLPETQENTDQLFHRGENSRDGRIDGCGRGLNDERDYDEKRCDRVKNNPDSKKMVYDETRWGSVDEQRVSSGISKGQFVRSKKKRRLQKVAAISCFQSGKEDNGGNEELSGGKEGFECLQTRTDDNREREAILALPCPDDVKADINSTIVETGITSGTPGSPTTAKSGEDVVKADFLADDANGSGEIDVKDQSHEDMITMSRFQSGKDCSRENGGDEELSGRSFLRGKEKQEGFECLQTRTDDKRESEAAPTCPDDVKTDMNSTIVETGITSGSPTMSKSAEDVVKADLLADDALGTSKELLDQSHKDMIAMSRFLSGKECSRDNGGDEESSGRSFLRGKEKQEGFECLQTRTDDKRESEAILAPTCPDDVKTDINSMIVETGITSGSPGSPTTSKSAGDVVKADLLADDTLGTSKELLERDVVFKSGLYKDRNYDERRMGIGISEGHFVRCRKKRRLQKECVMSRIQSGKEDSGGDEESNGGSFRGKENKGFECLQTRTDYERESEAILAPPCPDVKAAGIISTLVEARITSGLPATAKSGKDVLKSVVSESGIWGDGANGSGEIAVKDQLQMWKVKVDDVANADVCIIVPSALTPPQPCSDANNDLAEIELENQPQRDTNLHSPIVRKASRSALRKKLKRARIKVSRKTSVQMRNDSGGDADNAKKDCIIPSASTQPRSGANTDSGEIAVKSRPPRKDVNLHSPIVCVQSRSARRKKARQKYKNLHIPNVIESHIIKRKAKNKISHETGMMMINDGGDIINVSDCIIPSAPPQLSSGTNVLGQIVAKSRPLKHTNLQCPTVDRSHSTRLKKWKARNKRLQETSIVSEKAGSNCDPCKPVVPNLKRTRSSSMTISASPYVADSVIPECSGRAERLVTSTEDEKVQQYVHQTFLAKVSSGQYVKLGTDRVDDISEHPLHNGPPLVDSFLEGINIAGSSQGDSWSSEIHACSERDSAMPLKPNNSDMGSADANANEVFLKELNTQQVVSSEVNISSEANNAVNSKIWRRKCFECGELEQCSSLCLKVKAANNALNLKKWRQKCFECGEIRHSSSLCPKVKAANSVVSSNIQRRTCFECGGCGHISSLCPKVKCYECGKRGHMSLLCPKVKAANNAVSSKIRRRKCYECGECGHISLFCPNVKADDSTNPDKETGELKGYTHVMLDAVRKKGTVTNLKSSPKDTQVQSVYNFSTGNDVQVSATGKSNPVGSSKIRKRKTKRKCYDCRDSGHIKSLCPKIKADDSANADANSKENFLKEFNTLQVNISSEANNAVYREPGHISSLRPTVKSDDWTNRDKETGELKGYTHVKLDDVPKKGTMTNLKSAPKDNQVHSSYNFSAVNEVQGTARSKANLVSSSKIWKRKCFECREFGHIKSLYPKIKADDSANAECDGALPLKPDSGIISDVGSADANSKEVFLKELNTPQVVTSEVNINSQANCAVSSKKRKGKSYECGEPGHISLLCPKVKADDSKNPDKKLDDVPKGTVTNLKLAPKDNQVQSGYSFSAVNEVEVTATSKANPVGSSKICCQTWYDCRECGHIKSCLKIKADDLAIAISRYLLAAPYNC